jgi:NAD(P)H-dependent FMN reductase
MSDQTPNDLNSSLSSLAMLSLQMKTGKDYLDYLHGFVIEALSGIQGEPFDAAAVQKAVEHEFALKIPVATFVIYLKRLVKLGTISPVIPGTQFRVVKLPSTTTRHDREAARARINEVTDELAGFAHSKYSLVWDDRQSAKALAEFLRQYSIDFLRFADAKSPLPEEAADKKTTHYVVASFITSCANDHPGLFESIRVLVQSHILANALMCPDLENTSKGFRDVHFLADTKFLLKTLDLESQYDTDNARQLLKAIQTLKGVVCIFPETKDELQRVLQAIVRGMQHGAGRGPVYRELLKRRRGVADVILTERNLDQILASFSISTLPSPKYDDSNYVFQIDEKQLRDEIETEIDYFTDRAEQHDIRAVRHIFALRKGRRRSTIEDCGYVFLTTNAGLSRAAFYYEKSNSEGWFFSAVVTDFHLSHLAWLKSPMEVPDLPRAEILANCYATMRPHESLWHRYLEELDRLKAEKRVSERDHEVLRFSLRAPDELMEVTRGDVEGITVENLHIILEKLEKTYATDKEQALQRERSEHEATRAALQQMQEEIKQRRAEAAQAAEKERVLEKEREKDAIAANGIKMKLADAHAKLEASQRLIAVHGAKLSERARHLAKCIAWSCFGICAIACLACALSGLLPLLSGLSAPTRGALKVLAILLGLCDVVLGVSVKEITNRLERYLGKRLQRTLERSLGVAEGDQNPFKPGPAEAETTAAKAGNDP